MKRKVCPLDSEALRPAHDASNSAHRTAHLETAQQYASNSVPSRGPCPGCLSTLPSATRSGCHPRLLLLLALRAAASAAQVTKDEEELVRQRLEVKRGLPLQDLAGNRGFPAE